MDQIIHAIEILFWIAFVLGILYEIGKWVAVIMVSVVIALIFFR